MTTMTATEAATIDHMRSTEQRRFLYTLISIFERNANVWPMDKTQTLPDHDVTFNTDIEPELKALFEEHLLTIIGMFWPEGFSVVNDGQLAQFAKMIPTTKGGPFPIDAQTYVDVLKQNGMASFQHAIYSRIKPRR